MDWAGPTSPMHRCPGPTHPFAAEAGAVTAVSGTHGAWLLHERCARKGASKPEGSLLMW